MTFEEVYGLAKGDISDIQDLIPSNASPDNKLIAESEEVATAELTGTEISMSDNSKIKDIKIFGKSIVSGSDIISIGDESLTITINSTSAALSSKMPLQGINVRNAQRAYNYILDNTYWLGDTYDGHTVERNINTVDLGDLTWQTWTPSGYSGTLFLCELNSASDDIRTHNDNESSQDYVYDFLFTGANTYTKGTFRNVKTTDKTICMRYGSVIIRDDNLVSGSDVTALIAAITGMKFTYRLAIPRKEVISSIDAAAFEALPKTALSSAISNSDNAFMKVEYYKDTIAGRTAKNVITDSPIKSFNYVGTGTSANTIAFPETPFMVLSIFGGHTYNNTAWDAAVRPFAWGSKDVFSEWVSSGSSDSMYCTPTYDGKSLTINGNVSDPGTGLNASGSVYTVYYI